MKRAVTCVLAALLLATAPMNAQQPKLLRAAAARYLATSSALNPQNGFPRSSTRESEWQLTPLSEWTSGFYAGTLWYLYSYTHNAKLKQQAIRWTLPLAGITNGTFSHDLGFQFNSSFANAYRITSEERFRIPVMTAARLLANRFNPKVGAIKSWDWMSADKPFPVIADNMMNLELLFWAARQKNADPRWRDIAVQHARTTLANHVRPDGSSYHVVVYDPNTGKVLERITHQGYANESTWARGQAWLIYGFTMTFRETGDTVFLNAARKVADYFVDHLPRNGVPCWDFNAPDCPNSAPRDASAAAIAASGLLELSTYAPRGPNYRATAEKILSTLSSPNYVAPTSKGAVLQHAVGNLPAKSEVDVGITYGDYYFVEALLRSLELQGDTAIHVMPARLPNVFTARGDLLRKSKERWTRGEIVARAAVEKLRRDADSALRVGPFTVTAKERTPPSGDKHDYVSYGPYWWPDSSKPNGLPYVQRDGQVNPVTRRDSDVLRWYALVDAVETLAHAYYFTDQPRYADRATLLLRTWFIDPATRMNPNQNYGQAIPGVVEGRGIGLIDVRDFGRLLDAITLLETSPAWTSTDNNALRAWLTQYTQWLKTSKNGTDEAAAKNNHGTWYDTQLGSLELFLGDTTSARELFENAKTKRIASEIDSLGRQPLELARTRSLHYSVENLEGMTRMAELARHVGVDLWHWQAPNGASIRKAINYVAPYADTTVRWPGQQITKEPDDLFLPLLLRARIALADAKYVQLAERLPERVTRGHRAYLLYPQPHESQECDVGCLVASQVMIAGRRTLWAQQGRWLDPVEGADNLLRLMTVGTSSSAVQAAVNGGIAYLRESGLYGLRSDPVWAYRYEIGTNTPDTSRLVTAPQRALMQYESWVKRRFHAERAGRAEGHEVIVDARASRPGAYRTIAAALGAAPKDTNRYVIHIRNGRYNERIAVERPNVRLVGQSRDSTILSFDIAAGYKSPSGGIYGTRGSSVLRVAASGFELRNMTVENTFDYMANYAKPANDSTKLRDSQGVAVMLDQGSDRAVFENCRLWGHQDTLFPNAGRSYFHQCVIGGSVDFIFGAGRAVFDAAEIVSRDRGSRTNNGYISAASTPLGQPYGFLILNSRLVKETPTLAKGSVSLGRPWHPSSDPNAVGNVVFSNTWMDDHISTDGWQPMNSFDAAGVRTTNKPEDARFFEYDSKGPGAVKSPTRRVLTDAGAQNYTVAKVLDGWIPK